MENILITGGAGMLGQAICRALTKTDGYRVFVVCRNTIPAIDRIQLVHGDLTKPELYSELDELHFSAVIHCAAEVNVNRCEQEPAIAYDSNVRALQMALQNLHFDRFFHLSTDSVFDGARGSYTEEDPCAPVSVYSKSKREAELLIEASPLPVTVLRTNLYGFRVPFGRSLFEWAFQELRGGKTIGGFSNMFFNPLYIGQIAEVVGGMLETPPIRDVLHLAAEEFLSKYEFLVKIADSFGFDRKLILEQHFEQTPGVAPRPLNTTLSTEKFRRHFPRLAEGLSVARGIKMLVTDIRELLDPAL